MEKVYRVVVKVDGVIYWDRIYKTSGGARSSYAYAMRHYRNWYKDRNITGEITVADVSTFDPYDVNEFIYVVTNGHRTEIRKTLEGARRTADEMCFDSPSGLSTLNKLALFPVEVRKVNTSDYIVI